MYSSPCLLMSGQPWQRSPRSLRYRTEISEQTQWAEEHVRTAEKIYCFNTHANQLSLYVMKTS